VELLHTKAQGLAIAGQLPLVRSRQTEMGAVLRSVLSFVVCLVCLSTAPGFSNAQDYSSLFRSFNAQSLTYEDKRFLQMALAFNGHYNGLLDGDWGPRSQRAMENYAETEFGTAAEDWHLAFLAFDFLDKYDRDGWGMFRLDSFGLSMLYPFRAVRTDPSTELFVNWGHTHSSLAYSTGIHTRQTVLDLHEYTVSLHDSPVELYVLRRPTIAVTSATQTDGSVLYTRSNYINGLWHTAMLSADRRDMPILNAVAASITVGSAPDISITNGGSLNTIVMQTIAMLKEADDGAVSDQGDTRTIGSDYQFIQVSSHAVLADALESAKFYASELSTVQVYSTQAGFFAVVIGSVKTERIDIVIRQLVESGAVPSDAYATAGRGFTEKVWDANLEDGYDGSFSAEKDDPDRGEKISSGTGFAVSRDGHFLTNSHVVNGCTSLSVDGYSAQLVAESESLDLALLLSEEHPAKGFAVFSPTPARLNSDVTAVGFPLAGILSGLNVTRGAVSANLGFGGDISGMQITAPVQRGNSGGPLLAADGEVVGVVVSKLDARLVADITGDIPQNVNFAIRGEIAKLFLFQNGVEPILGTTDAPVSPVELAELASNFTGFIECG